MYVVKRDGRSEPVHFDKITARISKLAYGLNAEFCDPILVAQKVTAGVYKGVKTSELDELASETAAGLATSHPDYSTLAARICDTSRRIASASAPASAPASVPASVRGGAASASVCVCCASVCTCACVCCDRVHSAAVCVACLRPVRAVCVARASVGVDSGCGGGGSHCDDCTWLSARSVPHAASHLLRV